MSRDSHATEEDIEEDKEIELDIKKEKINYQLIADMYNETCVSFPRLKTLSDSRKKAIKARLNTYSEEDFKTLFQKAEASNFLKGTNNRNWTATFDWLIKDTNMAKVLDGNYDNKERKEVVPKWCMTNDDAWKYVNDSDKRTVKDDPELAARAESLKQILGG